jgi:hypothetical protein
MLSALPCLFPSASGRRHSLGSRLLIFIFKKEIMVGTFPTLNLDEESRMVKRKARRHSG